MPTPRDSAPSPTAIDLALRGTAVLDQGLVPDALLLIGGEDILFAGPAATAPVGVDLAALAAEGRLREHDGVILPGLVDVHNHGGGGVSFPDCTRAEDALAAVAQHRRHGTTSQVASLVTASAQTLRERIDTLAPLVESGELAGIHLEGPFLSAARCGAQNPAFLIEADAELTADLCERSRGTIATMTIAPEVPGAQAAIEALAAAGAVPSLGHTDASSAVMTVGIRHSLSALARDTGRSRVPSATHLFNGMRPVHHRDPGPALACLDAAARGEMVVEVIGDGVHTAPETIAHVFALAAPDHVALVTDAMAAAGMSDGQYRLGELEVTVADGVATLSEGGSIAGGTAHLIEVVRLAVEQAGVDLVAAVRAASIVPARLVGIEDRVGSLVAGKRADVLLA
ncbi:MAG: amidohydrolase family protein, partial [Brachybacterium sp.]|nr:amidohydrolase family protein [Brachybacterium sp.]